MPLPVAQSFIALVWQLGRFALLAALLSGFIFIAPLIAVGLFRVSRALEKDRPPPDSRIASLWYAAFPVKLRCLL